MQKTSALCEVPFLKKLRKTVSKGSCLTFLTIFDHFEMVFLDFFLEIVFCRELRFFALHSVHQNAPFELSKSAFRHFLQFFSLNDPYDFGVVKSYTKWNKWSKKNPKKNLKDWTKWNRKSFIITSGVFGGTLLALPSLFQVPVGQTLWCLHTGIASSSPRFQNNDRFELFTLCF